MGVHSFLLQERDARLRFRAFGDASRSFPPVIKNLRDVPNPWRPFTQSKHELEVLDTVERRIESRLHRELSTNAEKMTDIHRPAKIFRRPVWFKEGFYEPAGRFIQLVFVGVNNVVTGPKLFGHDLQGCGMQQVVVIEKANVFAAGKIEAAIHGRTYP